MATVYRGYDPRFEREVAVKVLPSELLHSDPQFRLRFEREAKIIAQLEHPSIVPVYDVGEEGGQPYFVMRFMNGGSLSERIQQRVFSIEEATHIIEKVGPGLDEAHTKGIVHRDIKPSNILFDSKGEPYLSDFGIAKLSQAQTGNMTGSAIIGTPAYMAPEQAQGEAIDGRADIYALGIILYEMLTGKQPYEADTPMGVALKHITEPVPHIRDANPDLPPEIDSIIQMAMAKDREERFATSKEITDALRTVTLGKPTSIQRSVPKTVKAEALHVPPVQKRKFNTLVLIVPLFIVIGLAAAAGGIFLYNGFSNPARIEATGTATSAPPTRTSEPTVTATEAPVLPADTPTQAPPTETATPTVPPVPMIGGADKIAFVANNEIWMVNLDGRGLEQLTSDGAAKSHLQWLSDGETILFISGKTVKYIDIRTGAVDILTSFPSATSLDAFNVSRDGTQVMIALSREIFVVPFDFDAMKNVNDRRDLFDMNGCIFPKGKTKTAVLVKDALWAADDKIVAWLYEGVDTLNPSRPADLVDVIDIQTCNPDTLDRLDSFPGLRFTPAGYQDNRLIPSIDWDGYNLFVFNTFRRNNGWGELYVYDWKRYRPTLINPVNGKCCYRDAHWSPDGTYLIVAFQDADRGADAQSSLYYISYSELGTGASFNPIPLPEGFFKNPREAPQPALRPASP